MRTLCLLLSLPFVALTGCAGDRSLRRFDNPAIRKLQEEETARHVTDDRVRAGVVRNLGPRVRIVFSGDVRGVSRGFPPAGRAAALTADGYFLTAHHVVDDRPFYIEGTEGIRRVPTGGLPSPGIDGYPPKNRHAGRLVWSDPGVDLAIVKFPVEGHPFFEKRVLPPPRGRVVFTADDEGYAILYPDEHGTFDLKNAVGNGAFFAAGSMLRAARADAAPRSFSLSTSLVARGGMSGAPLVTADKGLCGVICRVEGLGPFQKPRTIATMIDPRFVSEIVDSDRRQQGANPRPGRTGT